MSDKNNAAGLDARVGPSNTQGNKAKTNEATDKSAIEGGLDAAAETVSTKSTGVTDLTGLGQ